MIRPLAVSRHGSATAVKTVAYDSGNPAPAIRRARAHPHPVRAFAVEASHSCPPPLRDAIEHARAMLVRADGAATEALAAAAEAAAIIGALTESEELSLALLARAALSGANGAAHALPTVIGAEALRVAQALQRLGTLGLPRDWSPAAGLDTPTDRDAAQDAARRGERPAPGAGTAGRGARGAAPRALPGGARAQRGAPWRRAPSTRRSPTASAYGS